MQLKNQQRAKLLSASREAVAVSCEVLALDWPLTCVCWQRRWERAGGGSEQERNQVVTGMGEADQVQEGVQPQLSNPNLLPRLNLMVQVHMDLHQLVC